MVSNPLTGVRIIEGRREGRGCFHSHKRREPRGRRRGISLVRNRVGLCRLVARSFGTLLFELENRRPNRNFVGRGGVWRGRSFFGGRRGGGLGRGKMLWLLRSRLCRRGWDTRIRLLVLFLRMEEGGMNGKGEEVRWTNSSTCYYEVVGVAHSADCFYDFAFVVCYYFDALQVLGGGQVSFLIDLILMIGN